MNENLRAKHLEIYTDVKNILLNIRSDNISDKQIFTDHIKNMSNALKKCSEGEFMYLKGRALTRSECEELAGKILDKYYQEISKATTEDEKLEAILRCAQDMSQSHFYTNGNTRTIYVMFNKFCLENGLPLVIFDNPNVLDCKSIRELKDHTKQAGNTFNSYQSAPYPFVS
jgi:hypothetical protein